MQTFTCAPTLVTQCGGPTTMAKCILGHGGGRDPRIVPEMRRLQRRVRDLEAELARLQEEKAVLAAEVGHELVVADLGGKRVFPLLEPGQLGLQVTHTPL